jgi:hypothetical protein
MALLFLPVNLVNLVVLQVLQLLENLDLLGLLELLRLLQAPYLELLVHLENLVLPEHLVRH